MIRRLLQLTLIFLLVALCICNLRLYTLPETDNTIDQLRFLRSSLDAGDADRMQRLFPEGYVFMHALYASAWIETGRHAPEDSPQRDEARREAKWAIDQIESAKGTSPFPADLDPPHGVFHAGWVNWLRGGCLSLYPEHERPEEERRKWEAKSEQLARAFDKSDTPFLSSYHDQAWPVDSVVAMASLKLHDNLLMPRFAATRDRWLTQINDRLDPATGLIPHRVDAKTGMPLTGARGSSQALLLRFLLEVDPQLGRSHYVTFRSQFAAPGWMLPGVREYPHGIHEPGDVDSGPLIGGVSLSATVTSIAPARMVKDDRLATPFLQVGEAIGVPTSWDGERRYLLGQLPIADAFLVYARAAQPWTVAPQEVEADDLVPWWWRLAWHAVTLLPIGGLLYLAFRKKRS